MPTKKGPKLRIRSEFILQQIMIAEVHVAGGQLLGLDANQVANSFFVAGFAYGRRLV